MRYRTMGVVTLLLTLSLSLATLTTAVNIPDILSQTELEGEIGYRVTVTVTVLFLPINITDLKGGKVWFGSAAGSTLDPMYTKVLKQIRDDMSVLEISQPITAPGVSTSPAPAPAPAGSAPASAVAPSPFLSPPAPPMGSPAEGPGEATSEVVLLLKVVLTITLSTFIAIALLSFGFGALIWPPFPFDLI